MHDCLRELCERAATADPAHGQWRIVGQQANVWVDASSLAVGACVEVEGKILEDVSWLRRDDHHINVAELDAVVKGLNLAIKLGMTDLTVLTDSMTVYAWVSSLLSRRERLHTSASSEMVIRRRLQVIQSLVDEYALSVTVVRVASSANKADQLTRMPTTWLRRQTCCAMASSEETIHRIHVNAGHPGVSKTRYFCRRKHLNVTRRQVAAVVKTCDVCNSLRVAAPPRQQGTLAVWEVWSRLAADFTHVGGELYLTCVDCGPSRFAMWKKMSSRSSKEAADAFQRWFRERGPPAEVLVDNDTSFHGGEFMQMMRSWNVVVRFRCAYRPGGNGIAERVHRTVKEICAAKRCGVDEALWLYNVSPHKGGSRPVDVIYTYTVRMQDEEASVPNDAWDVECKFNVGDLVWVRNPGSRCDVRSNPGVVTKVVSSRTYEVNGVNRNVRDLQPRATADAPVPHRVTAISRGAPPRADEGAEDGDDDKEDSILAGEEDDVSVGEGDDVSTGEEDGCGRESGMVPAPRQRRTRRLPVRFEDYIMQYSSEDGDDSCSESGGGV